MLYNMVGHFVSRSFNGCVKEFSPSVCCSQGKTSLPAPQKKKKGLRSMIANLVPVLILFPFLVAAATALIKEDQLRGCVIYTGSAVTIVAALTLVAQWALGGAQTVELYVETGTVDHIILACELLLMCLVIFLSCAHGKFPIAMLSAVQTLGVVWFEVLSGVELEEKAHMVIDRFTIIMVLIVACVGCLIATYAVGYMRGYHQHHTEFADRRSFFLPLLFVFIGAMFGLVLSANMAWMYFFWEITSVISFLLIGYTQTEEAVTNSFRALWMNLLGGLGYAAGIIWFGWTYGTIDLYDLVASGSAGEAVAIGCVALLAFAALTKSAQLPFSQWLLGAMVAPTPSSALLHSATMVKAGVYLLLRLAPAMHGNLAGYMVAFIGGLTFFSASLMAISTSDGKRVLAFSTISNLGLITACAGVGSAETVWAGLFLIVFHAVSKSMLFQCIGAIENTTHSRDVESMHGLIQRQPKLATIMIIGICGMFLAPFGMLISKWAALKSFVEAGRIFGTLLVLMVCFGSATTLLYWSKWLSKLVAINHTKPQKDITEQGEYLSLFLHAAAMVLICLCFPVLSGKLMQPILETMYGAVDPTISTGNLIIMVVLLACVLVLPALLATLSKKVQRREVLNYMAGINTGDNNHFIDTMGNDKELQLSAWYLENWFGENKVMKPSLIAAVAIIVLMLGVILGGALV